MALRATTPLIPEKQPSSFSPRSLPSESSPPRHQTMSSKPQKPSISCLTSAQRRTSGGSQPGGCTDAAFFKYSVNNVIKNTSIQPVLRKGLSDDMLGSVERDMQDMLKGMNIMPPSAICAAALAKKATIRALRHHIGALREQQSESQHRAEYLQYLLESHQEYVKATSKNVQTLRSFLQEEGVLITDHKGPPNPQFGLKDILKNAVKFPIDMLPISFLSESDDLAAASASNMQVLLKGPTDGVLAALHAKQSILESLQSDSKALGVERKNSLDREKALDGMIANHELCIAILQDEIRGLRFLMDEYGVDYSAFPDLFPPQDFAQDSDSGFVDPHSPLSEGDAVPTMATSPTTTASSPTCVTPPLSSPYRPSIAEANFGKADC